MGTHRGLSTRRRCRFAPKWKKKSSSSVGALAARGPHDCRRQSRNCSMPRGCFVAEPVLIVTIDHAVFADSPLWSGLKPSCGCCRTGHPYMPRVVEKEATATARRWPSIIEAPRCTGLALNQAALWERAVAPPWHYDAPAGSHFSYAPVRVRPTLKCQTRQRISRKEKLRRQRLPFVFNR